MKPESQQMSQTQQTIFQKVIDKLQNPTENGAAFMVQGAAGTGKTFLLNQILAHCEKNDVKAIALAYTGIASCLLHKGKTVHSQFRIPWDRKKIVCAIDSTRPVYKTIQKASVLLWDQAAFCSKHIFEEIDRFLRVMMKSKQIFGGKVVVVCGDFHECLPIAKKTKTESAESHSLMFSNLFKQMNHYTLNENYRFKLQTDYRFCLQIGTGALTEVAIPSPCRVYNLDTLINTTFGAALANDLIERTLLTVCAIDADFLNYECMKRLYKNNTVYHSLNFFRKVDSEATSRYYSFDDIMENVPKYFPPHILPLNKNCPIMLCQAYKGLPQGTRLLVKSLTRAAIVAEIGSGHRKGKLINIHRVNSVKLFPYGNLEFVRRQFPVSLAFSMTINKAQGLEFKRVGVYFPCTVFSHGQMYVTFSRVPMIEENMKVLVLEQNNDCNFDRMPNMVNMRVAKQLPPINI